MEYLNDLNEEQRVAVEHIDGAALVIASAGSGKTRVLTYRVAHLIANGIAPHNILALTFTNKAAKEMKERIANIVGFDYASRLWMGTFHSIFAKILRFESEAIGFNSSFTIYDTADVRNAIKMIIKSMNLDDTIYKPAGVANRISAAKNNLFTAEDYENNSHIRMRDDAARRPHTFEIYNQYARKCKQANAMDFDDLLLYTNLLFKRKPEVLAKYQERFTHILVDEYQDTNMAQFMIIKALGHRHRNVFMVGDDAQSIYSFRGAKIENILNFQKDYKNAKLFRLERNYRSTKNIVEVANSIIVHNKEQLKKETYSMKEEGEKVKIIKALTDNEEGFLVVKELYNQYYQQQCEYSDFAILYRTNAQSRILEEALRKRNIPYKIYGGLSFYQRKEIKDMLAYLRLIANPNDEEALRRVINYPKRGIGSTTIDKIGAISLAQQKSIWEIISNIPDYRNHFNGGTIKKLNDFSELIKRYRKMQEEASAFDLATEVALSTGILRDMKIDKTPEGISRLDNINELLNGIQEFSETAMEEDLSNNLAAYLENVALLTDMDRDDDGLQNHVSMMTVHAAKGLEFENVFVVGMEEKLFPSNIGGELTDKDLEEERRLFYVALTRAKNRVCLSFAVTRYRWGQVHQENPSRFLFEIDSQYLERPMDTPTKKKVFGQVQQKKNMWKTKYSQFGKRENTPAFKKKEENLNNQSNLPVANIDEFTEGNKVLHSRFGAGKILKIEGIGQNRKATVHFENFGAKTLLLKFAKLIKKE